MRLRTRLILALLLLSAVPLTAIVLVNYTSAQRAVRASVEAEADQLTQDMERRLGSVRASIRERLALFGSPIAARYFGPAVMVAPAPSEPAAPAISVESVSPAAPGVPHPVTPPAPEALPELGSVAELLHSIVIEPPEAPPSEGTDAAERLRGEAIELTAPLIRRLAVGGSLAGLEAARRFLPDLPQPDPEDMEGFAEDVGALVDEAMRAAQRTELDEQSAAAREARMEALAERFARRFGVRVEGTEDGGDSQPAPRDRPRLATDGLRLDLDTAVRDGGRVVGLVRPTLDPQAVLERVMGPIERRRGEIPFAINPDGTLFVLDDADRPQLEALDLPSLVPPAADGGAEAEPAAEQGTTAGGSITSRIGDRWVVVISAPQPGGMRIGIASPLGASLAAVRTAAGRNLAAGLALVALAAIGVLPLARRMTGDLEHLTAGADRIASGDLETAVEVRSSGEIAQLAGAFNHMAGELRAKQGQLVDQALKERLLAAELKRKDDELEAARRFQLSMLPRTLPEHPELAVAVAMRTAAEVGGDYYDFHADGDGTLTVAIGDATGHGATAGRMVTVVKSLFSGMTGGDPAAFLADANRTVRRMELGRMAMALALARFAGETVTVASAGMPPMLVLRRDGSVDEVDLAGMPLGGLDRSYATRQVTLASGELALLLSDGLPEQPDEGGDPFGYAAIREHLAEQPHRSPQAVINGLLELLDALTDGQPPADDVTFVAVARR